MKTLKGLTKKERHEIYKLAKDLFGKVDTSCSLVNHKVEYICEAIDIAINEIYKDQPFKTYEWSNIVECFPEMETIRPKDKDVGAAFWHPSDKEVRIKHLDILINLTKDKRHGKTI